MKIENAFHTEYKLKSTHDELSSTTKLNGKRECGVEDPPNTCAVPLPHALTWRPGVRILSVLKKPLTPTG